MRRRVLSGMMATALISLSAVPVFAQAQPQDLGTFKAWTAWKGADENGAICFISAATPNSGASPLKKLYGCSLAHLSRIGPPLTILNVLPHRRAYGPHSETAGQTRCSPQPL